MDRSSKEKTWLLVLDLIVCEWLRSWLISLNVGRPPKICFPLNWGFYSKIDTCFILKNKINKKIIYWIKFHWTWIHIWPPNFQLFTNIYILNGYCLFFLTFISSFKLFSFKKFFFSTLIVNLFFCFCFCFFYYRVSTY